eukprot:2682687-Amphidinium_carterae.1
MAGITLNNHSHSMTSSFSLSDIWRLLSDFAVELRMFVTRKRATQAVTHQMNSATQEDEEEEEDDDPTECGMGGPPKKGGTKKPAPRKPATWCAAYRSDKGPVASSVSSTPFSSIST